LRVGEPYDIASQRRGSNPASTPNPAQSKNFRLDYHPTKRQPARPRRYPRHRFGAKWVRSAGRKPFRFLRVGPSRWVRLVISPCPCAACAESITYLEIGFVSSNAVCSKQTPRERDEAHETPSKTESGSRRPLQLPLAHLESPLA